MTPIGLEPDKAGTTLRWGSRRCAVAFTLIELIVVIGVLTLLIAMLLPGLSAARAQGRGVVCKSNLQQIMLANLYYSEQSGGVYVPGAANFLSNLNRWHGRRKKINESFDSSHGPLVPFLGSDGAIRQCPTFPSLDLGGKGFERGNGGYGYNNRYVGVTGHATPDGAFVVDDDRAGALRDRVVRPAETIMFTDAAFASTSLIEYSFAEPRFHPEYASWRADPSIHFRHRGVANVAWCDGHVDAQPRTYTWSSGWYPADPDRLDLGWFGAEDSNKLFDLK